jgi:hypothetical protein
MVLLLARGRLLRRSILGCVLLDHSSYAACLQLFLKQSLQPNMR